ncbi:MAG: hypoxanthine phosphoribosyltransferase [Enterovibrio sp.]
MKHSIEVLISEKEIQQRIYTLAEQITDFYRDSSDLVMIGLLRGSFIFIADLARSIQCPLRLDFMTVSSYGASMHSGDVTILKDLEDDIKGRDVLLVEDIIDTGKTLHSVREILARRKPKSIRICTLLDKPSRREIDVPVDWVGFQIPDEFVVGLGIDYAQKYRNLPYIGKVVPA